VTAFLAVQDTGGSVSQRPIISTEALAITKPKRRHVEDSQKTYQYVSAWAENLPRWLVAVAIMEFPLGAGIQLTGKACFIFLIEFHQLVTIQ